MRYQNPVIRGFYPDPSVCAARGRYYLVCSTMQYFPGVPVLVSDDLVNWTQLGYCLTRPTQVALTGVPSSGGVFAPTLRYHAGRFYMVTTNSTTGRNFYVWTEDPAGEWSEPIEVDQGGIDPSLLFEDGRTYFISTCEDDDGVKGIVQCEIDIATGRRLTGRHTLWQGSGGRYPEGPHLYHIGDWYYLLIAEGGTEYGHMVTLARSRRVDGGFTGCPSNPVLTNRNLGGYQVQGVGHGDLVQDQRGNWWLVHLGFRQTGKWDMWHHLGRETFLTPVTFTADGWLTAGDDGTVSLTVETDRLPEDLVQRRQDDFTLAEPGWERDWAFLRLPERENYRLETGRAVLRGTDVTLEDAASPTFLGLRQRELGMVMECTVALAGEEAGLTVFMDEDHHYDLAIRRGERGAEAVLRKCIGDVKTVTDTMLLKTDTATLKLRADAHTYFFSVSETGEEHALGTARTRYLATEVAGGFTGVMAGIFAVRGEAVFTDFHCRFELLPVQ